MFNHINEVLERRERAVQSLLRSFSNTSRVQIIRTLTGEMKVTELEKLAKSLAR